MLRFDHHHVINRLDDQLLWFVALDVHQDLIVAVIILDTAHSVLFAVRCKQRPVIRGERLLQTHTLIG